MKIRPVPTTPRGGEPHGDLGGTVAALLARVVDPKSAVRCQLTGAIRTAFVTP